MEQDGHRIIRVLPIAIGVISLLAFVWCYYFWANILISLRWAALVGLLLAIPLVIYKQRIAIKNSGLTNDEYLLKEVGGADTLFLQASNGRLLGWLFVLLPVLFALAIVLVSRSIEDAVGPTLILAAILWPFAWWFFRLAIKHRSIAEQAGTIYGSVKARKTTVRRVQ